ncbi:hypothetical protein [Nonomuraea glycinis]|uniref:hypothetical protein n=1 Tax=Nonomuraea glycinis TaxID=2047744 RepID=UPI002E0E6040|nr:hypothetical protein OHA68_06705 [Nonomuraea glycinis]
MNRSSKAFGLLIVGWVILGFACFATFFGGVTATHTPLVVAMVGAGLGFFLTAIVAAIYDRGPR